MQFITAINLTQNEIQNFSVQKLATAPASPVEAQMYYNTTDDKLYYRTASTWIAIEASAGAYTLPVATTTILGGVKDGTGLTIDGTGVISVDYGSSAGTAVQGNDARVTADQAAGTASIRTIGTGALQAAAGNHNHTVDTLSNVVITANTDNEVLAWDSASSKWINQTAAEAGLATSGHTHANDHVPATVLDSASIDFSINGQEITGSVIFGSTATTAAAGNHNHTIDSLSNVIISANSDNEVLAWDSGSSKWINQTAAEAGLATAGHTHANDHVAATVVDTTSIDLTITGQQISAAAIFGSTAGTVAEGNHTHASFGNLTITGNLTVNGTTTTLNTTEMVVSDNKVVLNNDVTGTPTEDSGIEVERGTSANVSVLWNETADAWTLTNDGTNFHNIVRKHVSTIGDGTATSFVVTHNLNTRDLSVTIRRTGTPYDVVIADVECTSLTAITVYTSVAPTAGQYTVVIQG